MKRKCCSKCGTEHSYNEGYDAFYCPECNEWISKICSDMMCCYCPKRPKRPLSRFRKVLNKLFRPYEKT